MNVKLTKAQKIKILNSDDLYGIMQRILLRENKIDRNREHFWVIGLENNNRILFIELVSKGTLTQAPAEPMEVFSLALQKRAARIILCHNHPSGELQPSEADKNVTDRLIQTGKIVKTPVVDHLVISEKSYYSFSDSGLLQILEENSNYIPSYIHIQEIKKAAREIGRKAGIKEKAKEMARQCLEEDLAIDLIAKLTGLTEAEIKKLKVKEKPTPGKK
ncbi:MAG: DNA repair protein [Sinomicrobium sp.]|nr:DNA repair protein [Sinomicrobium sp.]